MNKKKEAEKKAKLKKYFEDRCKIIPENFSMNIDHEDEKSRFRLINLIYKIMNDNNLTKDQALDYFIENFTQTMKHIIKHLQDHQEKLKRFCKRDSAIIKGKLEGYKKLLEDEGII